jgi:hypothetical protein
MLYPLEIEHRRAVASLLAMWALATPEMAVAYDLFFDTPKRDQCVADGVRQWSAIIDGRGYRGDWVDACRLTRAEINGNTFPALNCGWQADSRVWGQFQVPDQSCRLLWFLTPKKDQCVANGLRQWSAIITGSAAYTGDWIDACRRTTADIDGTARNALRCSRQADQKVWGEFEVPDSSCKESLHFLAPARGACQPNGTREYSAIIDGENFFGDWTEACKRTTATIDGSASAPLECYVAAGNRVWGRFEVADATCHMRVRGRLLYRDYRPQPDMADNYSAVGDRPIRGAPVEIWFGPEKLRVTHTDDAGSFDVYVPSEADIGSYRAVVIASNEAGQVNLRDNTATWYWTPEQRLQKDGDGLALGDPVAGFTFTDPHGDAMSFNALDALLAAYRYATSHGIPKNRINQVAIIPTTSDVSPHTTASGAWSLTWLPVNQWQKDVHTHFNFMFADQTILHEYAHHLERMNDTFASWPSTHDGCNANFGWSINSAGFAWFEGFPDYFSFVAGRASTNLNGISVWPTHFPPGAMPPAGTLPSSPCDNPKPKETEDFIASLLLELMNQTFPSGAGGIPMSRSQLETRLLTLWFDQMRGAQAPGTRGMPTVDDFANVWNAAFPGSQVLNNLMKSYGMR